MFGIGRQMQVREEHLALAQHLAFVRLGLLDLHDHVGGGEHLRRRVDDPAARAAVRLVVHADALSGIVLDDHFVAAMNGFADAARRQSDPVFQNLDFLGHTNAHLVLLWLRNKVTRSWPIN